MKHRLLRRLKNNRKIEWLNKKEFSYLTVDLRDICSNSFKVEDFKKMDLVNYDWDRLEKSIVKYGILNPLEVYICSDLDSVENVIVPTVFKMCKYNIVNGQHRLLILKKLYPPRYKVKIKINNNVLNK